MSNNKINNITLIAKDENRNDNTAPNYEKNSRFLQDIQLLTSLKSIPGKIIPLKDKMNEIPKITNKDNSNENNNNMDSTNRILHRSKSIFTPMDKPIINNINNTVNKINNTYTTNNFFFNNGVNNTNINFNLNPIFNQQCGMGIFQDQFGFLDPPGIYPQSNHPSFLSFKSDLKNNLMQTENKYTQNSFLQNMILNNKHNNQNDISLNKNNNILSNKFSQLSFHQQNLGKEIFLKKKLSTNLIFRKDSDNNSENNINYLYNNINVDKKNSSLLFNKINENSKKENKNIINIKEEEEKEALCYNNNKNNNKKILFNIENYSEESYEEEDDNIYHNIKGKLENNNNLFNCFHKKKKKRRKIHEIKKYKCTHPSCDCSYKTIKQLQSHHYKMISECQLDSVQILKLIYNTKIVLLNLISNDKKKKEYFGKLYEKSVNNIGLNNYSESITGIHIDDII